MKDLVKLAPLLLLVGLATSPVWAGNFDGSATSGLWSKQQKLESQQYQLLQRQQQMLQQQQRQNRNVRIPFRSYPGSLPLSSTVKPGSAGALTVKKSVSNKVKSSQAKRVTVKATNKTSR